MGGKRQDPALATRRGPGPLENARWEAFCHSVVFGVGDGKPMTRVAAYKRAGFTGQDKTRAYQISKHPLVKARIAELQLERKELVLERQLFTRDHVIQELLENIRESKRAGLQVYQGQVVYLRNPEGELVLDEHGEPIPLVRRDGRAINEGLELLGRELGMFPNVNKLEHARADPFEGLTLREILAEARNQMAAELGWDVPLEKLLELVEAGTPEVPRLKIGNGRTEQPIGVPVPALEPGSRE